MGLGRHEENCDKAANGGPQSVDAGVPGITGDTSAPTNTLLKEPGPVRSGCMAFKKKLQSNRIVGRFLPPVGDTSIVLTLALSAAAIFLCARTVLGPIAGPGGTLFALLVLVLVALLGGLVMKGLAYLLLRICSVDIRLPPLLGMLIVGIFLKNVPYNFGQFGRAECFRNGSAAEFVDSLHDIDSLENHIQFKRSVDPSAETAHLRQLNLSGRNVSETELPSVRSPVLRMAPHPRVRRSQEPETTANSEVQRQHFVEDTCRPKYIGHDLDPIISVTLRSVCLTVILLMAGLELDPVALWKLSGVVMKATFIPCFAEAASAAILSHLILGFPWTVGFMLGFVLAAVSPAVIIPSLMSLSERGYGVAKGIPTLVIAACSADDVVAISGFGIFMGIIFSGDAPLHMLVLHGPIEIVIGTAFGVSWGVLCQWLPDHSHKNVVFFRWLILFSGGLISIFGAHLIHYEGAGGLSTIILAFVASMEWRKSGWGHDNPVATIFKKMWIILEPVIFALIGTEIQVDKIDPKTLGYGLIVLTLALVIRMIGTYFAVSCGNLNFKEKIFMAFAWLPKATVQAALGPIFLNRALLSEASPEMIEYGEQILTIAVLSILITAPLGAISILALGPQLLESNLETVSDEERGEGHDKDITQDLLKDSKKAVH